jgi:hypothetical protein
MKSVHKYPLPAEDHILLSLPINSKILSVINQNETIMLYVLVDLNEVENELYNIRITGTGHIMTDKESEYQFIGTITLYYSKLVFHVFYKPAWM